MSMDTWMEDLTPDDMPTEDTRLMAGFLGVELTMIVMNKLPGVVLNIPENGLKRIRNRYICENYDGTRKSKLCLAVECKVTEGYIRRLISRERLKHEENN